MALLVLGQVCVLVMVCSGTGLHCVVVLVCQVVLWHWWFVVRLCWCWFAYCSLSVVVLVLGGAYVSEP